MIVLDGLGGARAAIARPVVATVGNFDGVHRGHRAIMERVLERARATGAAATVVTFAPHPLRILAPDHAPRMLMTRDQKLACLEELGLEAVVFVPFDRDLAGMPAESFVRDILVEGLGAVEVYIGPDFRFGRGRAGDVALLDRVGREHGLRASAIAPVALSGERVSASRIRHLLGEGDVARAAAMLGRPPALVGTIVHGEGRGRTLLFPTANLAVENEFLPGRGVYVTRLRCGDAAYPGVTNIGVRPTFGDTRLVVETFLPGFEGDLYGVRAELEIHEHLRSERKFDSPQALRAQIERDIAAFHAWRARHPDP